MEQDDASSSSSSSSLKGSISQASSPIKRLFSQKILSPRSSKEEIKASSSTLNLDCKSITALERVFNYFDENRDGKISPDELQRCVRTMGGELSDEEAEMVVVSSDADGDGLLGLEDFTKLMEVGGGKEREDELREAFEMYAVEGTCYITPKSLKRMLSKLGEKTSIEDCKVMICKFDINGDGVLSFDEFRIMMQ